MFQNEKGSLHARIIYKLLIVNHSFFKIKSLIVLSYSIEYFKQFRPHKMKDHWLKTKHIYLN